jgi:hypothetical protein
MSSGFELAQINIGRLKAPLEAPESRGFVDNLERINALAERQPGFVWRLVGEGDDATDILAFDDPMMLLNMSVWTGLDSLAAFVYRTEHREVMRQRASWFHKIETYLALWWVPAGYRPTPAEGRARVETLARLGPTSEAFSFRQPFPAADAVRPILPILDKCA